MLFERSGGLPPFHFLAERFYQKYGRAPWTCFCFLLGERKVELENLH